MVNNNKTTINNLFTSTNGCVTVNSGDNLNAYMSSSNIFAHKSTSFSELNSNSEKVGFCVGNAKPSINVNNEKYSQNNYTFASINKRLQIVQTLYTDKVDVSTHLSKLFTSIMNDLHIDIGLNSLEKLLNDAMLIDQTIIINIIVEFFEKMVEIYIEVVKQCPEFNFEIYVQIWKDYDAFFKKVMEICKIKSKSDYILLKKLELLKIDTFYTKFICHNDIILTTILNYNVQLSYSNIESYVKYIESNFELNMYLKKNNKLSPLKSLQEIFKSEYNLNLFVYYIDRKIKQATCNKHFSLNSFNKQILNSIKNLIVVLKEYSDVELFTTLYLHYFKTRITAKKYGNIDIELKIIDLLSTFITKLTKQTLLSIVNEVNYNNLFNRQIKSINVIVQKDKYKQVIYDNTVLQPLLVTQKLWKLQNVYCKDIKLNNQIKYYMKVAKRIYENTLDQITNTTTIIWNYELGYATVEATLNNKLVTLTCTILQLNLLLYINQVTDFSINDIQVNLNIDYNLSFKLVESLLSENLLTYSLSNDAEYDYSRFTVNVNYNASQYIDLRKSFISMFNTQVSKN